MDVNNKYTVLRQRTQVGQSLLHKQAFFLLPHCLYLRVPHKHTHTHTHKITEDFKQINAQGYT